MEGCKKEQKINAKLMESVYENLSKHIIDIRTMYVVELENSMFIASYIKPDNLKRVKNTRKSSITTKGNVSYEEVLKTTSDLMKSIIEVKNTLCENDVIRTVCIEGSKNSLLTIILNTEQKIVCFFIFLMN